MAYLVKQSDRAPAVTSPVPVDESLPRACVIGAGSSGIAAAKQLHLAGIPFDCYEMGSDIGGTWVLDNSNGQSACYDTLEINTSCPRMAYSDFPMPADYPPYAKHDQVRAYGEAIRVAWQRMQNGDPRDASHAISDFRRCTEGFVLLFRAHAAREDDELYPELGRHFTDADDATVLSVVRRTGPPDIGPYAAIVGAAEEALDGAGVADSADGVPLTAGKA